MNVTGIGRIESEIVAEIGIMIEAVTEIETEIETEIVTGIGTGTAIEIGIESATGPDPGIVTEIHLATAIESPPMPGILPGPETVMTSINHHAGIPLIIIL